MSDSEDFGIDDDDTAFVAVATQLEAQNDDNQSSPRPLKRRRVSDKDHYNRISPDRSSFSNTVRSDAATLLGSASHDDSQHSIDEDYEGYYFAGELAHDDEDAKKAHLARYKIHVPKRSVDLPSVFLTQTQMTQHEDPTAIRGPIWKKPTAKPPPSLFNNATMANRELSVAGNTAMPLNQARSITTKSLDAFVYRSEPQRTVQQPAQRNMTDKVSNDKENLLGIVDLTDLPPGAFSSSDVEDAPPSRVAQKQTLRAPTTGLKQMTIHGHAATQPLTASQAAKKRHAWPLTQRDEAPTHHKLDPKALEKWIYPTNLGTIRDYQFNIVSRSLYHNTLVALPTGLGKTFIAATVMLNYYHWTTHAQIIFMAPTKPLIAQQMEACYGIVGIPRRDTVLMTGETTPAIRAEEWLEKRVFFMTPQTVINDLKTGICDPKKIILIVVDEAHKATGGYAYTEVVSFLRRFNPSFRVLALTATPGSTVEAVQSVIDNLGIARVEVRTEASIDIRRYTHEKHTETEVFDYNEEQTLIMGHISKAIQPVLDKLSSQNAYWSRDPMQLTPYGLMTARGKWSQSEAGRKAPMPIKGMVNSIFTTLASLAHGLNLLKFHGIGPFFSTMRDFQKSLDQDQVKRKYARQIAESDGFNRAMGYMRAWSNNVDFIGHPKMQYLREIIMNHFIDAGEGREDHGTTIRPTRVMIFSSFRDSTDEICRVLKRTPLVRPHVFVGQSASKSSEGMDQKKQNAVIQDFKSGKYNTLVATSIGEEGLDIGDVDLIICYDASSSPIRMLQRIGRTGRKRVGRVVLLLMRTKEENDYIKAQDSYAFIQKTIADESKYSYRDDQSPRIVPKEVHPVVDKRVVDIPVENSQPIDLNEKRRKAGKGKAKRPGKKFHMPDGVETGFVKASALDSDDNDAPKAAKRRQSVSKMAVKKAPPAPLPEPAAIPYLSDVLLTAEQVKDHDRRYARTINDEHNTVIEAPDPSGQPDRLRHAGLTKYIGHGRYHNLMTSTLAIIHDLDQDIIERVQNTRQPLPTELHFATRARLMKAADISDVDQPSIVEPVNRGKKRALNKTKKHSVATIDGRPPERTKTLPPVRAKPQTKKSVTKQAAPRGQEPRTDRANTYGSDAMEGSDSEPDPTPAELRIGTQGIDLGSRDTSGEDEDEEPDSDLERFVVNSDAPIEMLSSSLPPSQHVAPQPQRRRLQKRRDLLVETEESEEADYETAQSNAESDTAVDEPDSPPMVKLRKVKRVLDDSDDDE